MHCHYALHNVTFRKRFDVWLVGYKVFNATFNNISVISGWSVLLVEKTRLPRKTTDRQVTDKLYQIMLYTSPWAVFELTTSVVIGTNCIGSCKSNYHTITAATAFKRFDRSVHSLTASEQYFIYIHDDNRFIVKICRQRIWEKNLIDMDNAKINLTLQFSTENKLEQFEENINYFPC